ncbi:MAG: hypothetical protein WCO60_16930 [Verrucomicrobiota bacterium]
MSVTHSFASINETLLLSITTLQAIQAYRNGCCEPDERPGVLRALAELSMFEFPAYKRHLKNYREILWTRARDERKPVLFLFRQLDPAITLSQLLCDVVDVWVNELKPGRPLAWFFAEVLQEASSLEGAPVQFSKIKHYNSLRSILSTYPDGLRDLWVVCDWLLKGDDYRFAKESTASGEKWIQDVCGVVEGEDRDLLEHLQPPGGIEELALLPAPEATRHAISLLQILYELQLLSEPSEDAEVPNIHNRLGTRFRELLRDTLAPGKKDLLIHQALRIQEHAITGGKPLLWLHRDLSCVFSTLFVMAVLSELSLARLFTGDLLDADFPRLTKTASRLSEAPMQSASVPPGALQEVLEKIPPGDPGDLLVLCDWALDGSDSEEVKRFALNGARIEDGAGPVGER